MQKTNTQNHSADPHLVRRVSPVSGDQPQSIAQKSCVSSTQLLITVLCQTNSFLHLSGFYRH